MKMKDQEFREWIKKEDWYQTIELKSGLKTKGKFPTGSRIKYFEQIDFKGKSVLDVGCNSGQYCLYAKKRGAEKVVGIDFDKKRIEQARILSEQEDMDIHYEERSIYNLEGLGKFDIVFCIAVLTELTDLSSAIRNLARAIGGYAFIEMAVTRSIIIDWGPKSILKKIFGRGEEMESAGIRKTKNGDWIISPSMPLLRKMFGEEFNIIRRGKGLRYDIIELYRKSG